MRRDGWLVGCWYNLLVLGVGGLVPLDVGAQDCMPERYESAVDVLVTGGRAALQRPLGALLVAQEPAVRRCFARQIEPGERREAREADVMITVQPEGTLAAEVTLRGPRGRRAFRSDDDEVRDAAADEALSACLVRALTAQPLLRPRVARPAPMRVRVRHRVMYTPARPCSDPAPPVRHPLTAGRPRPDRGALDP